MCLYTRKHERVKADTFARSSFRVVVVVVVVVVVHVFENIEYQTTQYFAKKNMLNNVYLIISIKCI